MAPAGKGKWHFIHDQRFFVTILLTNPYRQDESLLKNPTGKSDLFFYISVIMRKYFHVNTFTTLPMKGNPAGVVLGSDSLKTTDMQAIARDLALPETVFVLKPVNREAVASLRWFSPAQELEISGHGTLAAITVMIRERLIAPPDSFVQVVNLDYKSGQLAVSISKSNGTDPSVWINLPVPALSPFGGAQEDIFRHLGITDNDIDSRLPIMKSDTRVLIIPVLGLLTLRKIAPNFENLKKILHDENLRGVSTFCRETVRPSSTFHSRYFSPGTGINEDPVTGLVNGILAHYWVSTVLPSVENRTYTFSGEQGEAINREGEVKINVHIRDGKTHGVEINGAARILLQGTLEF